MYNKAMYTITIPNVQKITVAQYKRYLDRAIPLTDLKPDKEYLLFIKDRLLAELHNLILLDVYVDPDEDRDYYHFLNPNTEEELGSLESPDYSSEGEFGWYCLEII